MLAVGSRNGRKVIGFGVRGEMEENELEEGEAFYQDDDDSVVDNDVALSSLSYIEEKLQDVLGHFQKDFEGGVSAENLGAKFGGYGSFLPTCPRSPSIRPHETHARTPPKVQTYSGTKSPNNFPLEGARQNLAITATTSHSIRGFPPSSLQPGPIASHVDKQTEGENLCTAYGVGEFIHKQDHKNRSANDRKMPMVGSDNFPARNNAAIYTGLGLDISPSSSPEDDVNESGGLPSDHREITHESPTSILQTMTSFPVPGGCFLSPIPESLLHLTERPFLNDSKAGTARKAIQAVQNMFPDELPPVTEMKGYGEIKMKPIEKTGRPMVVKIANGINSGNDMGDLLKKEIDIENLASRELVSNGLKVLNLSRGNADKIEKQINVEKVGITITESDLFRDSNNGTMRDATLAFNLVKEEALDSIQDTTRGSNMGSELVPPKGKLNKSMIPEEGVWGEKKTSHKDIPLAPKKDDREKDDNRCDNVDYDGFKGRKDHSSGPLGPLGQKSSQKATSYEPDGVKMPRKAGKRKQKGHHSNGTLPDKFTKDKEESQSGDTVMGNKNDVAKSHKESCSTVNRENQSDFLVEVKAENTEHKKGSSEKHFKDKLKGQKVKAEKETLALSEKSKERSAGKKFDNLSTSEAHEKAPTFATQTANGPASDAVPALAGPSQLEDNWVCCDRCQTWRLLPFGRNSDDLPEKWICSMIDWLPGMNSCTFSEEETTRALNALYQVPVPESQNYLHSQYNGAASGTGLADGRHDQSHERGSHAMPSCGKKKHASNAQNHATAVHLPNSNKKNQQASLKSANLNDVNQYTSKSNDCFVENPQHKRKEKNRLPDCYSDGGGYADQGGKQSKTKVKGNADRDICRTSKKIKTEFSHYTDEDRLSDHTMTGKALASSSNRMLTKLTGKSSQKHGGSSSAKELKGSMRDNLASSGKKQKMQVQNSSDSEYKAQVGMSDMGIHEKSDFAAKKRKVKEWQRSQVYPETFATNAQLTASVVSLKEEASRGELRKEKKAKISKSEGRESSKSKADGSADMKGRVGKIVLSGRGRLADGREEGSRGGIGNALQLGQCQVNAVSQRMLDGIDSLKRDLGSSQNSITATSSSSKVSVSRKSKASCQEAKGSPVESVSSSPFRVSNMDKLTTDRVNLGEKAIALDTGFTVSPRRCSDGVGDCGTYRSRIVRKELDSPIIQDGSLENRRGVESSLPHDRQDRDANQTSGSEVKDSILSKTLGSASQFDNDGLMNCGAVTFHHHNPYLTAEQGNSSADNPLKLPNDQCHANGSRQRKSDKGSSRSRDEQRNVGYDVDKGKTKCSNYLNDQAELYPRKSASSCVYKANIESGDRSPYHEDPRDGKFKSNESWSVKSCKNEKIFSDKKEFTEKWFGEGRTEHQLKFGVHENNNVGKSNLQQNPAQVNSCEYGKSLNEILSSTSDHAPGRDVQLFSLSGDKQETEGQCPQAAPHKESRSDALPVDASNGDALKLPMQPRKPGNLNGTRQSTPNGFAGRDLDAPSPGKRGSDQAAAKALKEATDIKHSANRLKDKGLELESTDLYFQASLKFLHAASLLEVCNVESAKHGETTQSMQVYTDTAKLCEFCALKYEKYKEMAAAALAYKCMEVAHMRVIYCKKNIASKDWQELHTPLQVFPPGESPSSSASDVDNLNKGIISPQIAGNHVIAARNRPNFERLLKFTRDVDLAMDASRRWQNAFSSANVAVEEARYGIEGVLSVRRVLDFSFHDIAGLLRLVRLAMEAVGR